LQWSSYRAQMWPCSLTGGSTPPPDPHRPPLTTASPSHSNPSLPSCTNRSTLWRRTRGCAWFPERASLRRAWARRSSRFAAPLPAVTDRGDPPVGATRGREPVRAARAPWAASFPGPAQYKWDLFHFIYIATEIWLSLENVNLGFYLLKNHEINFVRIYRLCSILEKYEFAMWCLVFGIFK
jgi:hypothetical protein